MSRTCHLIKPVDCGLTQCSDRCAAITSFVNLSSCTTSWQVKQPEATQWETIKTLKPFERWIPEQVALWVPKGSQIQVTQMPKNEAITNFGPMSGNSIDLFLTPDMCREII